MTNSISVSRQYAPLRVCADMAFYFYVIAMFSITLRTTYSDGTAVHGGATNIISQWSAQLALMFCACLVLGFLIVRIRNTAVRFLLSLLPGLTFLMSPIEPALIIAGAAWIYYVIYMTVGSFEIFLDVYRRRARTMLIAVFLLTCALIILHFGTDSWHGADLFDGELYGPVFFVLSVLSLRGMRLNLGAPMRLRALDSVFVVALPALLIAAFFLLRGSVPVLTYLLKLFTRFLIWLYRLFFPEKELPKPIEDLEERINNAAENDINLKPIDKDPGPSTEPVSGEDPHFRLSANAWLGIIIIALIAALVIITIRLIRNKPKGSTRPGRVRERIEIMPFDSLIRRRAAEPALSPNVRQIRKTYRSYLDLIREMRMKIAPSDTSKDVLDNTSACFDVPENRALREIYIAARYGDPAAVSSEQAAEAKRCLSVIEDAISSDTSPISQGSL